MRIGDRVGYVHTNPKLANGGVILGLVTHVADKVEQFDVLAVDDLGQKRQVVVEGREQAKAAAAVSRRRLSAMGESQEVTPRFKGLRDRRPGEAPTVCVAWDTGTARGVAEGILGKLDPTPGCYLVDSDLEAELAAEFEAKRPPALGNAPPPTE